MAEPYWPPLENEWPEERQSLLEDYIDTVHEWLVAVEHAANLAVGADQYLEGMTDRVLSLGMDVGVGLWP